MSEITTAARPYAKAAFELADADKSYDKWSDNLQFLAAVASDQLVQPLFSTPALRKEERAEAFLKLCEGNIDDKAANLVRVMAENNRLPLLPAVAELYEELSDEAQNIVDASVTSAYEVSAEQQEVIKKALSTQLGKKVELDCEVDPSLLGGVVIRAGDMVIDGSVHSRIAQLANELVR